MRLLFQLFMVLIVVGAFVTGPKLFKAQQAAQKHFVEASQRIEATLASGKNNVDLSGLTHLRQVPESILRIPNLVYLSISETEISSLHTIGQLTKLEHLAMRETRVKDLEPLTGLPELRFLNIGNTLVQNLEPLTRVSGLERVDIGNTEILTLEPATRIRNLLWINLHRSYAHDGSRQHYDTLSANVPEVYNGSAFKQNYTPHPIYLRKTQANRLADWFYLPQPFPRP